MMLPFTKTCCLRCCLLLCFAAAALTAREPGDTTFNAAVEEADERLENALAALNEARETVAAERVPLSQELASLKRRQLELQAERDRLRRGIGDDGLSLDQLEQQVDGLRKSQRFVTEQLETFAKEFQARIHYAENQKYGATIDAALNPAEGGGLATSELQSKQLDLVRVAIERVDALLGGYRFEGGAIGGADDALLEGIFLVAGPEAYFQAASAPIIGLAQAQTDGAPPAIAQLEPSLAEGIAAVAQTGSGALPFDPTLGTALRVEAARKGLRDYIEDGDVIGQVILALGAIVVLLSLFKIYETLSFRTPKPEDLDHVLGSLRKGRDEALREVEKLPGASRDLLRLGVQHADESRVFLEELLFERVLRFRPQLERFLPFIAIAAAAAPLLGLLGTVVGMIKTFELITVFGTGDAQNLSSGISEALVTTALGLIVAIPSLVLHGVLSRFAKAKVTTLEQVAIGFVNGIPADDPKPVAGD